MSTAEKESTPGTPEETVSRAVQRAEEAARRAVRASAMPPEAVLRVDELVHRIVGGFMEPALGTPREEWHLRYRAINRAAGVIAGYCVGTCAGTAVLGAAQGLKNRVERVFADNSSAPDYAQRVKLCEALTKRTAAVLVEMGL